jgi:cellulose synthase/poly-beta-1,6-N-acetylglucosamine synthase-like glycosyltransferase
MAGSCICAYGTNIYFSTSVYGKNLGHNGCGRRNTDLHDSRNIYLAGIRQICLKSEITAGMKPKLSICIPTYNRAAFLKECLDSVLPQVKTKDEVEVIVIDNASTDDTQAVVKKFIALCDCLKYYRNENNLGYAGNQVKCIEYTTGDYMAFLCDDD